MKENTTEEVIKKAYGLEEAIQKVLERSPGIGPRTGKYGYTSESELRERADEVAKLPQRKLSSKDMELLGIDLKQSPSLRDQLDRGTRSVSDEDRARLIEQWLSKLIDKARKASRLMTDQQLADWRIGRKLMPGDRAKYIGPTRKETTQAGIVVERANGQEGIITSVQEGKARIITFHPMEAVAPETVGHDKQFVDLQVREHTKGWLDIERIAI